MVIDAEIALEEFEERNAVIQNDVESVKQEITQELKIHKQAFKECFARQYGPVVDGQPTIVCLSQSDTQLSEAKTGTFVNRSSIEN